MALRLILVSLAVACSGAADPPVAGPQVTALFSPATAFQGCLLASPLRGPDDQIIATASNGEIGAIHPMSGARAWTVNLPVEAGETAQVLATPVRIDDL